MNVKVRTNNVPREIVDAYELTVAEREPFDYLDWAAIEDGRDSASFVRYRGELMFLGDFTRDFGIAKGAGLPDYLARWDGYRSESFALATVIRFVGDDRVIMGMVLYS